MYRQLADLLRESIQAGEYADGRFPPERQLAEQFNVSATLVRSALDILVHEGLLLRQQGRGTFLADHIRRKPDNAKPAIYLAMSHERWRTAMEGPSLYVRTLSGMLSHAESAGYELVLHTNFDEQSRRLQSMATSQLLAGALVFHHAHARRLRQTLRPETPIVCLDHCVHLCDDTRQAPEVSYIACDNRQAARQLAHYMIRKGHRQFAFVGGLAPKFPTHAERIEGVQQAMVEAGFAPDSLRVMLDDQINGELTESVRAGRITAIIAMTDHCAMIVLSMLQNAGVNVPGDVSIAAFDDLLPTLSQVRPAITAMAMPADDMSELAWTHLASGRPQSSVTRLPYTFSKRDSVAHAPSR